MRDFLINSKLFTKLRNIFPIIFLLAIFTAAVLIKVPLKETFENDPEEGNNLMKSLLYLKGFSLYGQIWSDQPPLFTVILAFWFKLFGASAYAGRILTLIFSNALLFAFYWILRNQLGIFCAIMAALYLILSNDFIRLSTSVMIGLPALSFMMFSILCATLYKKSQAKYLLILSAIFMALSLQTKLFAVFLTPLVLIELFRDRKNRSYPALYSWLFVFGAVYFSIILIFFHSGLSSLMQQLIKPHYLARAAFDKLHYSLLNDNIYQAILNDCDTVLLSLSGIAIIIIKKSWRHLFPFLWLLSAFLILLQHRPVWLSHYLLLSIPLSWLAAISIREFFYGHINSKLLRTIIAGLIIISIVRLPVKYTTILRNVKLNNSLREHLVIKSISKYNKKARWIFTDRPIFAFYANILTPPELAVISKKRIWTGNLTSGYLISTLERYKPELVLLGRFENYNKKIVSYFEKNYFYTYLNLPWFFPELHYKAPLYRGKSPFLERLHYFLWKNKLNALIGEFSSHLPEKKLTLYIRKNSEGLSLLRDK